MKKNNKGFMLVEVIVTSTVIVTALIGLYTSFNKIYNAHKLKNQYYNIDAIYATKEMINTMLNHNMPAIINDIFDTNTLQYLIKDKSCMFDTINPIFPYCSEITNFYQIENMVIVEYDKTSIIGDEDTNTIGINVTNESFKEYIQYIVNYYNITDEESKYSYLLLTEMKDGDNYYYANLRVR